MLRNFDIVDEAGAAVPILTAEQNGRIARRLLGQLAEEALDTTEPVKRVLDCLDKVVGTEREARAALMELKAAAVKTPPDRELAKLWEHPIAQPLMQDLAEHFILFAVLDAQAGDRRVLKFVYDGELTWESEAAGESLDRWRKRVEERVGLGPVVLRIAVPGVGATHSYHAEVPAPEDLVITRARLLDVNSKELSDDRTPDRAHLWTTSSKREQEGRIVLELRVGARGLYGAAVWISLLTTLLFGAGLGLPPGLGAHPCGCGSRDRRRAAGAVRQLPRAAG